MRSCAFITTLLLAATALVGSANEQHNRPDIEMPGLIHTLVLPSVPGMPLIEPGKGMFLVAGRNLRDQNFANSVVLLVEVDAIGVLGLIINRVTGYPLAEVIPELQDAPAGADLLYLGGPVNADAITLLMRSESASQDAHHVFNDVYFSTSTPLLKAQLNKLDHENRLRVYAGHAGWGAGQLQHELRRGDWHLVKADAEMLFNAEPEHIWLRLIRSVSGLLVENVSN